MNTTNTGIYALAEGKMMAAIDGVAMEPAELFRRARAYKQLVVALRDIEMETRQGAQWTLAEVNEAARGQLRALGEA